MNAEDFRLSHAWCEKPRLITIVAPAGYGKTMTARQLAGTWEDHGYCDAFGVEHLGEFAGRLLAALPGQDEASAARIGQQLAAIGSDGIRLVETARQAWLATPSHESAIVLDHLESIDRVDGLRELLNWLLERPNPGRSVFLCSRVPLRLRTTRFALPHESLAVGTDDLRLSLGRIRELFPESTPEDVLREVEDVSRGWPIAVLYLVRASREHRLALILRQLRDTPVEELEDYLTHEVLSRLEPRERIVLAAASAIPNLTVEDVTIALECSRREATDLLRTTPFVTGHASGTMYEAHPLLRALIRDIEGPLIRDLLGRVASRYLSIENAVRAAELLVAAGDTRQAASALAAAIANMKTTYLFRSPSPELARTIAALTVGDLTSEPLVWNVTSLARVYNISFAQWLDESRLMTSRLDPGMPLALRAGVVNNYANSAGMLGLFEEARGALDAFERELNDEERPIGCLVADAWRIALDVWQGPAREIDVEPAQQRFAPIITADDGTIALWHFNVMARYARSRGDRRAEELHLALAREAAEKSPAPLVQAVVLSDRTVSAWFWGDDAGFAEAVDELERVAAVSVRDGIRHLIACCRGRAASEPVGFEQLNVRVFSFLIAAASAGSAVDAERFARHSVEAADAASSAFLQTISRVALALLNHGEARTRLLDEALGFANRIASPELNRAVSAIRANRRDAGMLKAFVARYDGRTRTRIHISLLDMSVYRDAERVALQRREFEVLAALALQRGGIAREQLADRFWRESEPTDGLNNLKVYVRRLRQKLGTDAIASTPQGYVLSSTVSVDLAQVEAALGFARLANRLEPEHIAILEAASAKDVDLLGASLSTWRSLADVLPRFESAIRDSGLALARDALARSDWQAAAAHGKRAFERDPCDDLAAELTVRALTASGDDLGAARIVHDHDAAMRREFGLPAAERLRSLVQQPPKRDPRT